MNKTWPPEAFKSNFICCLPDKPGIKRRPEVCANCNTVHVSAEEIQRCLQQQAWREQS